MAMAQQDTPVTPATIDDITAEIVRRVEGHKNDCAKIIQKFEVWSRLYLCQGEEQKQDTGGLKTTNANSFVPEVMRQTEALTVSGDAMVHGDTPFFMAKPKTDRKEATLESVKTQAVLVKQLADMKYRVKATTAMRSKVLNGTLFVMPYWKFSEDWHISEDGASFERDTAMDGPDMKVLNIQDVHYWPTKAADVDEADGMAYESEMTETELNDMIKAAGIYGQRVAGVVTTPLNKMEVKGNTSTDIGVTTNIGTQMGYTEQSTEKKYKVIDAWCRYPLPASEADPPNVKAMKESKMVWRFVIVNGMGCAIQMPNPFRHGRKPFLRDVLIEAPTRSMYGIGLGFITENPQIMINGRRNSLNDLITLAVYGPWKRKNAPMGTASRYVKMSPNRIFDEFLDGDMDRMDIDTSVAKTALELEAVEKDELRIATGATAFTQGMTTGSTATEFRGVASQSTLRVAAYALSFSENIVKELLLMMHSMNKQYFLKRTDNQTATRIMVDITGENGPYSIPVGIEEMLPELGIEMSVATDLEFRPQMRRNIKGMLGDLLEVRKQTGNEYKWNFVPLVHKFVRLYGEDGARVMEKITKPTIDPDMLPRIVEMEIQRRVGQLGSPESNAVIAQLALQAAPADKDSLAILSRIKGQALEGAAGSTEQGVPPAAPVSALPEPVPQPV